jgi:hypothetical protein
LSVNHHLTPACALESTDAPPLCHLIGSFFYSEPTPFS